MTPANPDSVKETVSTRQRSARDRVLLYISVLDIQPASGLRMAAASLEEAPESPSGAMDALARLLDREGFPSPSGAHEEPCLLSYPPINRRSMVSAEMDRLPWRTAFKRFLSRRLRKIFGGREKQ